MAWIDAELEFSDAQAVTTSAASTNIIDLQNVADRIGEAMKLAGAIPVGFTAGGAATMVIAIQESVDSAFSSPITLVQTGAIAVADLGLGVDLVDLLPLVPRFTKRYVRAYYTVATGPMLTGAIDLAMAIDVQTNSATSIAEAKARE